VGVGGVWGGGWGLGRGGLVWGGGLLGVGVFGVGLSPAASYFRNVQVELCRKWFYDLAQPFEVLDPR